MKHTRVGIVGFGNFGQRLADSVILQDDMQLVGILNRSVSLQARELVEAGIPYDLYVADSSLRAQLDVLDVPVMGGVDDLLEQCDVVLDTTPAGVGAAYKRLYDRHGCKAIFQGWEHSDVANVLFHGYANYERGVGQSSLKMPSSNAVGLIRAVDALDRLADIERIAITIIRRASDADEPDRGVIDLLKVEPVPNHQAAELMHIMPHITATGFSVHAPITHGHIVHAVAHARTTVTKEEILSRFAQHPRIRVVRIADGFNSNTAMFNYYRDLGRLYEIAVWEDSLTVSDKDITFAINIPQEAVIIPETLDAVRACMEMQYDGLQAVNATNQYLGLVNQVPATAVLSS